MLHEKTLKPLRALPVEPRFAGLSDSFHTRVAPTPLPEPRLVHFNEALAAEIGLDHGDPRTDARMSLPNQMLEP